MSAFEQRGKKHANKIIASQNVSHDVMSRETFKQAFNGSGHIYMRHYVTAMGTDCKVTAISL